MTTHELKLDTKYFNKAKNGSKNFEIRKNDRDFKVGDILELKAYSNGNYVADVGAVGDPYMPIEKEKADKITAKVTSIVIVDLIGNDTLPDEYVILGIEIIEGGRQ